MTSVSPTPSSSITSYNPVIFYFIGAILSSMFYKKDNFNIKKQLFPFLIFFFVLVVILSINKEIQNVVLIMNFLVLNLSKSLAIITVQKCLSLRYFTLTKLGIKRKKCFKFYHLHILLTGDVSLNPAPSQYLPDNKNKFQPFRKRGLHFLDINVNGLLSKTDEQATPNLHYLG